MFHGRIRAGADKPWMEFTGEQVNTYGPVPERFFKMNATMARLPVDVLHVFTGDSATMRIKVCSLLSMVNTTGPELTRAETVTVLNDLCVLAPAALPDPRIVWTPMADHQARATFTRQLGGAVAAGVPLGDLLARRDGHADLLGGDRVQEKRSDRVVHGRRGEVTALCGAGGVLYRQL